MIINPWIFYWIEVLASVEGLLFIVIFVSLLFAGAVFAIWVANEEDGCDNISKKYWLIPTIVGVLSIIVSCFIPSKDTMYSMWISSYVTTDNIETATDVIKDSVDYIFEKFNEGEE